MARKTKRLGKILTGREKRFIKRVVATGAIGQSAVDAGFANKEYGSVLIRKDEIREAILNALAKEGVTESYIAKKLKEGLEAKHPKRYSAKGTVIQDATPDYFTRGTYIDRYAKIALPNNPEKIEMTDARTVNIIISPEMAKALADAGVIDVEEVKELPKMLGEPNGNQ